MSGIHFPTNKFTLFQNFRFDSVFYLSCAARYPSYDGCGFLMGGCPALLDRRSAMLTLVGTACRRRIHLQTYKFTLFQNIRFDSVFLFVLRFALPIFRWAWIPCLWLPCASRPEVCDAHARRHCVPPSNPPPNIIE